MASEYTLRLVDNSGDPITTGDYSLRGGNFSASTYAGTHISGGVWSFGEIIWDEYELWNESGTPAKVASFGRRRLTEGINPILEGLTMSGDIDMVGNDVTFANSIQTDSIIEKTSANGVTVDGVKLKDGAGLEINGTTEADNDIVFKFGTQTITGIKTWSNTQLHNADVSINTGYKLLHIDAPFGSTTAANKAYVDAALSTAIGVVQAQRLVKIVTSLDNSAYSRQTLESARTYLNTFSLTAQRRGVILFEIQDNAGGFEITPANSLWFDNYIDITAVGKCRINILNSGSSLTADAIISNIEVYDNSSVTRDFTNFTFRNSKIRNNANVNCTSVNFKGVNIIITNGGTLTLTNCKGDVVLTDAGTVTYGGSTRPAIVQSGMTEGALG